MEIPESMLPFLEKGKILWEKGKVGEILFSGNTYQVEILLAKTSIWTFLQFDEEAKLRDAFCTCPTSEKKGSCEHLAAAFLRIYQHAEEPLHIRYKRSLWYQLFFMAAKRHGFETKVLKKQEKGFYFCLSKTKKKLFSIKTLTAPAVKKIETILAEKPQETEETSLKFSSLSAEDLALYKAGDAPLSLRFELSFWSDLAKWLMILQDHEKSYEIKFFYSEEKIPQEIAISFKEIQARFYLPLATLPLLISSLKTVKSPLTVYEEERVNRISYDEITKSFHIHFEESPEKLKEDVSEGISIGEWTYIPTRGFFRKSFDPLLMKSVIPQEQIASALTNYRKTFENNLYGTMLHSDPVKAKYFLFFDEEKNLHIQTYVFEIGDLFKEHAEYFFPWVYLPGQGFYLLEDTFTEEKERIIVKEKVEDFVSNHRIWLHNFSGFQTHFGHFEAGLNYRVTEEDELRFSSSIEMPENWENAFNFGSWVYVEGQGFFRFQEGRNIFSLWPGFSVKKEEISSFIEKHTDELFAVKGFFSNRCPVEKMGISVQLEDGKIKIRPSVEYAEGYTAAKVKIFGSYSYVEEEGFYALPSHFRLPEGYREERTIAEDQESFFLNFEIDRLKPFILFLDHKLQKPQHLRLRIRKLLRERKLRRDFWIADLFYESDLGIVDVIDLWQKLIEKKKHLFSKAGFINLKQPRFNWLRYLGKRRVHRRYKLLKLTTVEWIRLSILENIEIPKGNSLDDIHTRKLLAELESFQSLRPIDSAKLKATLRSYQELGLSWLWYLYCHGLSGLLCDEMGLGKTHQAMALLAAISTEDTKRVYKYLVICPTSVIYHWEELLKKFMPEIRVCIYYGLARSLEGFEEKFDILLTSYGILRTGKANLKDFTFELAIFDEIQIAKNHRSQTHFALREIEANMKIGLTGTPIENRIRELKALFDIVLPGYLPPETIFREYFINPIEKSNDPEKRLLLNRLVKPFILRRKKNDVLLDLPEKIEEISYCDLSDEQKVLYKEIALGTRSTLLNELSDQSKPVAYMHVFHLLLKLKQLCDHPSLILGDIKNYQNHASGKWDLFTELLSEALESDQKVVIFSQFLPMLTIIESYLKKKGIGFAGIKGSTKNRQQEIRRFREDPSCVIFVASLLAAGVGIDLSCASIVIHYDRWWNPAKENQATDRVHRFGQNRGVQVFKLVTKNSVEEHIHNLIEKKKGLIEDTIGKDESDQIRFLSREELIEIVQKTSQYELQKQQEIF